MAGWLGHARGARLGAAPSPAGGAAADADSRGGRAREKARWSERLRNVDPCFRKLGSVFRLGSEAGARPHRLDRAPLRLPLRPGGDYYDLIEGLAYTGALPRLDRRVGLRGRTTWSRSTAWRSLAASTVDAPLVRLLPTQAWPRLESGDSEALDCAASALAASTPTPALLCLLGA